MLDGCGRHITYARISVTDLCNLRCAYCMPCGVVKKAHSDNLTIEQLASISSCLARLGVTKQRITGGEPMVRRGVKDLLGMIGSNPEVEKLCLTTNGMTLARDSAELRALGVSAVNISIDTLHEEVFSRLTSMTGLSDVLRGIDAACTAGFDAVKLNTVLLRGVNDGELRGLAEYAYSHGLEIRFIELMPFVAQREYAEQFFISADSVIDRYSLHAVATPTGDKAEHYAFEDGLPISFIRPVSAKFCSSCNRIRITADGKLLNCLHESREYDLKPYLSDSAALSAYITQCVMQKPAEHHIGEGVLQGRDMEHIGG